MDHGQYILLQVQFRPYGEILPMMSMLLVTVEKSIILMAAPGQKCKAIPHNI
jgi:hypothetical protein